MSGLKGLNKAMEEAAANGHALLQKSQSAKDPAVSTQPHHRAYIRNSATGKISNVEAKGPPVPKPAPNVRKMVEDLHGSFERHDSKGRGGLGISPDHPDFATPEKYLKSAQNILKYNGHKRSGLSKMASDEIGGMLNRHIKELTEHIEGSKHETQESSAT